MAGTGELFDKLPDPELQTQLQCVERELAMRRRVYANWVTKGRMKQSKADFEIHTMEAVAKTLKDLIDA